MSEASSSSSNSNSNANNSYTARRNDGKSNEKNNKSKADKDESSKNGLGKDGSKLPNKNKKRDDDDKSSNGIGNNKEQNQGNKNSNDKKNDLKNMAKQKAAEAALSTVMPAPIAKGLANGLTKNKNNDNAKILEEKKKIMQQQDRINMARNAANKIKEKKDNNEDEGNEESQDSNLASSIEDVAAKAENVKGIIKFLKLVPPPVLITAGCIIGLFFMILILFSTIHATTVGAQIMKEFSDNINESDKMNTTLTPEGDSTGNTSSSIQGDGVVKGTLVLPIKGSYSWSNKTLYYNSGGYHGGNDISVSTGNSVLAMDGGIVVSADTTKNKSSSCKSGYNSEGYCSFGKYIGIRHEIDGKKYYSVYAHLSDVLVKVGDKVTQGQEIAKSGNTGNSSGPHLHIAFSYDYYGRTGAPIYNKGIINPYDYIAGSKKGTSYVGDVGKNY